jgi:hypothetical protein
VSENPSRQPEIRRRGRPSKVSRRAQG